MAIAKGTIILNNLTDSLTVLISPSSCVISTDSDGSNPDFTNAYADVTVARGNTLVEFTLTFASASSQGIGYSITNTDDYHKRIAITSLPNGVTSGVLSFNLTTQDGYSTVVNFQFTAIPTASSSNQVQSDWKQDDSSEPDFIKNKPTDLGDFSNNAGYIKIADLPIASAQTLGCIKVGTNLSINAQGVLSAVDTTYSDFAGAEHGLVPPAREDDHKKFLRADGTWQDIFIPASPVQSDWNQTNTSALDYIRNKPTIPTVPTNVSAFTNDAGYITVADLPTSYTAGNGIDISSNNYISVKINANGANGLGVGGDGLSLTVVSPSISGVGGTNGAMLATDKEKLDGISAGADANVQSDWNQTDNSADDFIKNKPTNLSDFTNDAGYITSADLPSPYILPAATTSTLGGIIVGAGLTISSGGVLSATGGGVADSVAWGNITGTLADQSDLNTALGLKANTADLAAVAFSGSYNDLDDLPTIPAAQVQTDWNATTGMGVLLNKPTLATVATSGSYNDLTDTPNIPTVNNATLTIKQDNVTVGTFTANSSTDVTVNLTGGGGGIAQVQSDWEQTDNTAVDYIKNKPNIPAAQVQSDWNATSGMGVILNKPTLATVATSGSYNDLTNLPTIPAAQVQTDWNATTGLGVILNKPTNVSAFTNDAGYITAADLPTIPDAQVQADWDQANTSSVDYIKNKPTALSDFTDDLGSSPTHTHSQYLTAIPIASDSVLGGIKVGAGLTISSGGVLSATGGGVADSVAWGNITGTLADQSDLNTALGLKANTADLASVAFSGSYNDLDDTPTIPDPQIQSDWEQTNTSALDFIKNKPTIPTVPTNVSAFTNDAGYITTQYVLPIAAADVLGGIKVGAGLTISSGGVLSATGGGVADSVAWGNITGTLADQTDLNTALGLKANTADLASVAFSGSYNDLTDTPTIPTVPTNVSAFTNDAGYITTASLPTPADTAPLMDGTAAVGTSTDYAREDHVHPTDTSRVPTSRTINSHALTADITLTALDVGALPSSTIIPSVGTLNTNNTMSLSVNSSESFGGSINLHKISKTGSYDDLLNKPTIPTVNDATLTIQKNSVTIDTFTANASTNKTINITVPIKTSELTNDSGFITSIPIATENHLGCIKVGANLTITAEGVLSATDTTYSVFTADSDTTPIVPGSDGLVPAPTFAEQTKFLRGDGTWQTPTGTLDTSATSSLALPQNAEPFSSNISLHRISKTGKFTDLNGRPLVSKNVSYDPSGAVLAGWRPVCKLQGRGIYLMFMEGGVSGSNAATHAAIAIDIDFAHATIKQMWGNKVWDVSKVRLRRLSENGSDCYDWMVGFFHDETDSSPAYINFSIIGLGNEPADSGYDGGITGFDPYDDSETQSNLVKEISLREMVDQPGLIVNLESNNEASFDSGKNTKKIGVEGTLPISHGGTGASTAAGAVGNLLNAGSGIQISGNTISTQSNIYRLLQNYYPFTNVTNSQSFYIETNDGWMSGFSSADMINFFGHFTVQNEGNNNVSVEVYMETGHYVEEKWSSDSHIASGQTYLPAYRSETAIIVASCISINGCISGLGNATHVRVYFNSTGNINLLGSTTINNKFRASQLLIQAFLPATAPTP